MKENIATVGLDLAKNSFHVHAVDETGHCVASKALRRSQVIPYFRRLSPCCVAMETCSGSNWWGRTLRDLGHDVRLIPASYVTPYVKSQKNDALDAEAICEAAQRPNMRFAPLKSEDSCQLLAVHRSRRQLVKQRTMNRNHVRAVCAEFGVTAGLGTKGFEALREMIVQRVEFAADSEPGFVAQTHLLEVLNAIDVSIASLTRQIESWHRCHEASRRLAEIPGVGVMTATYLTATLADGSGYANGRMFAASLGLVPRQHSTGGKQTLSGITKRGDPLLRGYLFEGALALLCRRLRDGGRDFPRTAARIREKSLPVVAVEMANRNARTAWAMIRHQSEYEPCRTHWRAEVPLQTNQTETR